MSRIKQTIKEWAVYARNISSGYVSYQGFLDGQRDNKPEVLDISYEEKLVERISCAFIKTIKDARDVPSAYRVSGAWDREAVQKADMFSFAMQGEIESLRQELRDFLRKSSALGATIGKAENRAATVNQLSLWMDGFNYYSSEGAFGVDDLTGVPMYGNPTCYVMNGKSISFTAPRHKYHESLVRPLVAELDSPIVAEIGGGFGGLASFLLLGKPDTHYVNFDLPEQILMAAYYLGMAFPEAKMLLYGEQPSALDKKTLLDYDIFLLPNFCIPLLGDEVADLTINFASLSEMGEHTVNEYIGQINRFTTGYFFHENSNVRALNHNGHMEIPAQDFPVDKQKFRQVSFKNLGLEANLARYVQVLYEVRNP